VSGRPRNSRASSLDRVSNARPGRSPSSTVSRCCSRSNSREPSTLERVERPAPLPQRLALRAEPAATTTRSQPRRHPRPSPPAARLPATDPRVRRQLLDRVGKNCFRPLVYELPSGRRSGLYRPSAFFQADEDQREGRRLRDCRVDPKFAQRHRHSHELKAMSVLVFIGLILLDSLGDHGRFATSLVPAPRRSTSRHVGSYERHLHLQHIRQFGFVPGNLGRAS